MGTPGRSRTGTAWVFVRDTMLIGFLTVLLMELGLRALGFSRAVFYEPDSLVGWSGRPGAQGVYLDEGSAEVRISSAGVRDREHSVVKGAGVWRVAVLGDSYTEALQVAEDKRFTSVIERLLAECDAGGGRRVEVLNFGISGFGTAQEYLLLRDRVLRYAPDVVVLAFLPGNDIADNVRFLDPSLASRPYVTLNASGQIAWDRSFESARSFRIRSSAIYRALLSASDFSRVVQAAFFARDTWRNKQSVAAEGELRQQGQPANAHEPGLSAGIYGPPRTPEWQQAWNIAERLIEEMRSLTAQSSTRFLLVTLSSGVQVDPDMKRSSEAAERYGVADLFYADDRLHAFATQRGIEVLSLARPLAEYARRNNVFLHGFLGEPRTLGMNMNVLGSGHWNERGHQAAGEMIARYLCPHPPVPGRSMGLLAGSPK